MNQLRSVRIERTAKTSPYSRPEEGLTGRQSIQVVLVSAASFGGHDVNVDRAALSQEPVDQVASPHKVEPDGVARLADDNLGRVVLEGHAHQCAGDVVVVGDNDLGSQFACERQVLLQPALSLVVEGVRALDADRDPGRALGGGHPARPADQLRGGGARSHRDEQALAGTPDRLESSDRAHFPKALVDVLGDESQGEFAKGGQVRVLEEVLRRPGRPAVHVDLALAQALAEGLGRDVHELDLVGKAEHGVGNGLVHRRSGDLPDGVRPALDVLDIEGRKDVDARVQEFHDVLKAFGMPRSGSIGVREFVYQDELGLALQNTLKVHLGELDILVGNPLAGDFGKSGSQGVCLDPAVGFNDADDHVDPVAQFLLGRAQHRKGLAHARTHTEEHLELPSLRAQLVAVERREERVGIRAKVGHGRERVWPAESIVQATRQDLDSQANRAQMQRKFRLLF